VFLDLNQKYKGYKLIKVTKNSAIFSKNHKEYEIKFKKEQIKKYIKTVNNGEYQQEITKQTIKQYTSNPQKIWKNVAIVHTPEGYRVTYVKTGSIIYKLGLRKGDIILEVNNQKLLTDADAWRIYKNINDFDEINIKIKRHNQIKELNYEIN
jgi:general secretion pathway protein C